MTKVSQRGYDTNVAKKVLGVSPSSAVIRLGHFCVVNNISAAHVAARLGVSRTTVYSWFTGAHTARPKAEAVAAKLLAELQAQLQ